MPIGKRVARRTVQTAVKPHKCFAVCPVEIPIGEFYIKDTLLDNTYPGRPPHILMVLAWHMNCAPLTRAAMTESLLSALKEQAKHPTHTSTEYSDA